MTKTRSRAKTHLEIPRTESRLLPEGWCGYLGGKMADGLVAFKGLPDDDRCKLCERKHARSIAPAKDKPPAVRAKDRMQGSEVSEALRATLGRASVDAPPELTHELWRTSCRGAPEGRCNNCWACERDAKVEGIHRNEDPYLRIARTKRAANGPMWSSLGAAITAWLESAVANSPSPSGMMLEKAELGLIGSNGSGKPEDHNLNRVADAIIVGRVAAQAYPPGGHAKLTPNQCWEALKARCAKETTSYEELAERLTADVGDLKAVVKHGRKVFTVELAARGLIPEHKPRGMATQYDLDVIQETMDRKGELALQAMRLERESARRARAPEQSEKGLVSGNG